MTPASALSEVQRSVQAPARRLGQSPVVAVALRSVPYWVVG
jgi:hypothetical protein